MKPKPKTTKRRPVRSKDKLVRDLIAAMYSTSPEARGWPPFIRWNLYANRSIASALKALYERETL